MIDLENCECYRERSNDESLKKESLLLKNPHNVYFIRLGNKYSLETPNYTIVVIDKDSEIKKKYDIFYNEDKKYFIPIESGQIYLNSFEDLKELLKEQNFRSWSQNEKKIIRSLEAPAEQKQEVEKSEIQQKP